MISQMAKKALNVLILVKPEKVVLATLVKALLGVLHINFEPADDSMKTASFQFVKPILR